MKVGDLVKHCAGRLAIVTEVCPGYMLMEEVRQFPYKLRFLDDWSYESSFQEFVTSPQSKYYGQRCFEVISESR